MAAARAGTCSRSASAPSTASAWWTDCRASAARRACARPGSSPGGQVATAARALARLGLRVGLVTSIGDDGAGERALAPLADDGVERVAVKRVPGAASQLAFILVDRTSGERTVLWHRDPRLALEPADLSRDDLTDVRLLHLDAGDPETAAWAAGVAREAGVPVLLDADAWSPELGPLLERVDFPIVSRELAEALGGPRAALEELAARGARFPVVTLGAEGCLAGAPPGRASPAFAVEARDTTGSGDVFHAAFGWALLEGLDAAGVLRAANAAAALSCRAVGAQGALPTREELEAFLAASPEPGAQEVDPGGR
ncbi:MAG: PfkB family carbohydrate kinase [Myxococcota bacterium]|nr:PfkB family carbohydrate kinase [Myxococcota bacterium]